MKLFKLLSTDSKYTHQILKEYHPTKKLTYATILTAFTVILQSAGGLLPGIGFLISPFSTLMVLFATMISLQYGLFTYLSSIILLVLIEPSELFIFPFTTGLLGLGMGWGLSKLNRGIVIIFINGVILFIGMCIPLYVFSFPIFGPISLATHKPILLLFLLAFSFLYSWLWLKIGLYFLRMVNKTFLQREGKPNI